MTKCLNRTLAPHQPPTEIPNESESFGLRLGPNLDSSIFAILAPTTYTSLATCQPYIMERIDFLNLEDSDLDVRHQLLRKQAKNILDSYNQDWDILSELFQNAIDAIDQNLSAPRGTIKFTFDRHNRQLSILDNGVGIGPGDLSKILRPSVSLKDHIESLRGEKGVGLSFLLFSTNNMVVESVPATSLFEERSRTPLTGSRALLRIYLNSS